MRNFSAVMASSLRNLESYGNLRFTARQLYYEVCRNLKQPKGFDLPVSAAVFGAGTLPVLGFAAKRKFAIATGVLAVNALVAGGLLWLRSTPHALAPPISWFKFREKFENFQRPPGLIENKNEKFVFSHPKDLGFYGLPRLLICQSAEIAAMLRENQFHLESSCGILSLAEAAPLPEIFKQMLNRAANPRMFFLHDASFEAYSLLPHLRENLDLPELIQLTILGLRPIHVQRLHLFAMRNPAIENAGLEAITFLSDDEKQWLRQGFCAEVAAVQPVRLLRVLRRLILGLPTRPSFWRFNLPPRESGFMSENYG